MAKQLKFSIIGESYGNGHPFSWSAIFNGYNQNEMELCGYPLIPRYLEKQSWPKVAIKEAKIISVWTQDIERSKLIAKASNIKNICNSLFQTTKNVNGVILARDDAENHLKHATPALEMGLPIFIDKPLALEIKKAEELFSKSLNSIIFSCSAFRYDPDLNIREWWNNENIIGIKSFAPKKWETYSIHAIEPILSSYQKNFKIRGFELLEILSNLNFSSMSNGKANIVSTILPRPSGLSPVKVEIITSGENKQPFEIISYSKNKNIISKVKHRDTFRAFKETLKIFTNSVMESKINLDRKTMLASILFLEKGLN